MLPVGLLLLLAAGSAGAQERQLKKLLEKQAWSEGVEYCGEQLPVALSNRPDVRAISAEMLTRLSLDCAALATGAGDRDEASWWWYTAANMHADLTGIYAELQKEGVRIDVPPARQRIQIEPSELKPGQVLLANGDVSEATPPHVKGKPTMPRYLFKHNPGVWSTGIQVEAVIGVDGRPRQALLLSAKGWPLHAFNAYCYLRSWRFEPATVDGRPIESIYTMTISSRSGY